MVIHGPSGCMGNYTGFDEPSWFNSPGMVFSSLMREEETILGNDEIVMNKITETCKKHNPPFVAVIGTPAPALIGVDYSGISAELEKRTGVPTFGIDTTGFDSYCDGMAATLSTMGNRFLPSYSEKVQNTVNILGYNNLDYCNDDDLHILKSLLLSRGFEVNHIAGRSDIGSFIKIPEAEYNIVVSASAMAFAAYLEERYGTPFCYRLPIGGGVEDWEPVPDLEEEAAKRTISSDRGRFLIIGDQIMSDSLRSFIERRYGCTGDISTFFGFSKAIARPGDRCLQNENDLHDMLGEGRYDVVIADPLFEKFQDGPGTFIPLPHPAVSSRLYWHAHAGLFSPQIVDLLDGTFE